MIHRLSQLLASEIAFHFIARANNIQLKCHKRSFFTICSIYGGLACRIWTDIVYKVLSDRHKLVALCT